MTEKTTVINPQKYYRLPWSLTDNAISWIEVTTSCNLACEGCYRPKVGGHKTLDEIALDLSVFKRERKSDCMSIAGGDPLVHPKIVEIVKMIKEGGWKPIVNTNGLAMTPEYLKRLKEAGTFGFTFHVDTSQDRRDSKHALVEADHNDLRQKFAEMVSSEGGLCCAFNQTVTSDTVDQIPETIKWAMKRPDIIHSVVFILYRDPKFLRNYDFFANGKKIPLDDTYVKTNWGGDRPIKAPEVVQKIREIDPQFEPCSYLNGTEDPNTTKWLISSRICIGEETFGWVTPRFMEIVQHAHKFLRGKWISYSHPKYLAMGKSTAFLMGLVDPGMRKIAKKLLWAMLKNPMKIFQKAYLQSFSIIQPIDVTEDSRMNMCDGCPDITVHNGKLYWSCRLEEIKEHGCFVTVAPKVPNTKKVAATFYTHTESGRTGF